MENYQTQFVPEGVPAALKADEPLGPVPAGFNERFLAYAVDTVPFVAGASFTLSLLVQKGLLPSTNAAGIKWKLLWIAAYVVYETVFSSGGRATLGKHLMGIRVRAADGSDLPVMNAFMRAISYFISSAPLNLGYILALVTPGHRAVHDYLSGSRVVSIRERGERAEMAVVAVSCALMAILAGSWVKQNFLRLTPAEKRQVAMAQTTVSKVAKLEEIYKGMYGAYTDDLRRLAALTGNPVAVRDELMRTLEPNTLSLATDGRAYVISAKARNWRKTEVSATSLPRYEK